MAAFAKSRHFANALRRAIDDHFEGNMTSFAKRASVPLGTVAHYCRPGDDGRYPSAEQLEKIVVAMPRKVKAELLMAFVSDLIPPTLAKDYEVVTRAKGGKAAPIEVKSGVHLPASTQEALEDLAVIAAENLAVRKMLEQTAKAMKG